MGEWSQNRVGGLALAIGTVLVLLALITHPQFQAGDVDAFIQAISAQPAWVLIHSIAVVGFAGVFVGLFSLHRTLRDRGEGIYAPLALYVTGFSVPLLFVGSVIDGFVAPLAVARHLGTSGTAQLVSRGGIELLHLTDVSLVVSGFLVLMVGVALSGASLLKARLYPPALSVVGAVVGTIIVAGYLVGAFGPFLFHPAAIVLLVIAFVWLVVLGIFLVRTAPSSLGS